MLPNVIFVVLDTFRADSIFTKLNNFNITPFIQNLFENSIYFENCIANSPWTLPSHISMFTGLYPTQNALISKSLRMVDNKTPILAEIMKNIGYFTMAYIENPWVSELFGLTRGFIKCFSNDMWIRSFWNREKYLFFRILKILNIINSRVKKKVKSVIFRRIWDDFYVISIRFIKSLNLSIFKKKILIKLKDNSIGNLEKVSNILKKKTGKNKPLFFFLNFLTTHDPYIPIKEIFDIFKMDYNDFKKNKEMIIEPIKTRVDIDLNFNRLSENEEKTIEKLYKICVYSADIVIKKLFSILKDLKILNKTYVIITSDHGEHLGGKLDHHLWEHSTYHSLYEGVLRVPLLIFNPNFKKKKVKEQVQLKDLFHTILDLTGISKSTLKSFDKKKSILYQINNNSTPKYIFGEYLKSKEDTNLIKPYLKNTDKNLLSKIFNDLYFLRSNTNKYIMFKNLKNEEFYDIAKDPFEQNNISNLKNEEFNKMKDHLIKKLKKINNIENLKNLITKKEQQTIINNIKTLKFEGI